MLSNVFSSSLSVQQALELANLHLENARRTKDPELVLVCCSYAESALSRMKTVAKKTAISSLRADDQALRADVATAYFEHGKLLDSLGDRTKAQISYKKSEKWGGCAREPRQLSSSPTKDDSPLAKNLILAKNSAKDAVKDIATDPSTDSSAIQLLPSATIPLPTHNSQVRDIAPIPTNIFSQDMHQPPDLNKLPKAEERLKSISQLVYCLELLRASPSSEDILDLPARKWLKEIEHDTDEQERLNMLATNMLREFARDELKDAKAVAEVVCLVPVLVKGDLQQLLMLLFHGIEQTEMLNSNLLEGLAQLVQRATPGHITADNLVKILNLISTRLQGTHGQSPEYISELTVTVSHVLDAMADSNIKDLDRVELHQPLAAYLDGLKGNSDPYLVFQAAYASQALLYVPDNETPWQAAVRRTGKVVKGVSGLVSAVKGLDINGFVEGLAHIQEGMSGAVEIITGLKNAYDDVTSLAESGQDFLDCMKEGFSISRKRAWYQALRGADVFLRNGQLKEFKRLVYQAPCQRNLAFQWGVCQRLGEIAANPECDDDTRNGAVAFLGEIYQNDTVWGQQVSIKQWILDILMQVVNDSENALQAAESLLQELEKDGDAKKQALYQACRAAGPGPHSLKAALPPPASPSLFDRVQNKPDVESGLRQLRDRRLEGRGGEVYIPPQAKASVQANNNARFPLMNKVNEFLKSDQRKVFLLQGDSGAGKSTFNRELECSLWDKYRKKEGRIPLFIHLPSIDKPERELIAKQLRKEEFTEPQIRELKGYREFILICDGYDESQQTHNLYTSNQLNDLGGWRAQMVISCRSEYLGLDYRDRFQPASRNHQADLGQFQEAVITPFSEDQVQDYIKQFVSLKAPLWQVSDYVQALDRIPSLRDLVTNPFLLTLSLDVLPRMMDPGQNLAATRVTRVALYDQFVEQWMERAKKRLIEKLSDQEKKAFESLSAEGFTQNGIVFLKGLAVAIYEHQAGNPVVEYSFFRDKDTWKEAFFSRKDERQLLREACPLNRSGNQYRFIHRSLLEYSLARAVFEPQDAKDGKRTVEPKGITSRRASISSAFSFESQDALEEESTVLEQSVIDSPLGWKNLVSEPSIMQFLVERAQQESLFKSQLLAVIERSKTEKTELKTVRKAAANAITILVKAGVQFNGEDLRDIQIPGADLSYGIFESAQLQGADLRKVILRSAWLYGANLNDSRMAGVQFGELPFLSEGRTGVGSCLYSPDGKLFSVTLSNGDISGYTTSNWERAWTLTDRGSSGWTIVYSPKGDLIASGGIDNTVRLWEADSGNCCHIFEGHTDTVVSVVYSPTGTQIASGGLDNTARLWDIETKTCLHILSGHTDDISILVYSPNGRQIASLSSDNTVRIWDVGTGACLHTLVDHGSYDSYIVYSPNSDQIMTRGNDMTLRIWDVGTGDCRHILNSQSRQTASAVYSPKGNLVAAGTDHWKVHVWDTETGICRYVLAGHSDRVRSILFSSSGDQIASCSSDKTVRLWDAETGVCHSTLSGHSDGVETIVYSPKGTLIASTSADCTIRLWDVQTGVCRHTLTSDRGLKGRIVFSPKGDQIVSCSQDNTVRLWDVDTGDFDHTSSGHNHVVRSIAYSPSGDQIASGSDDKTVRLWNFETGVCQHTLNGHDDGVTIVAYSPKGDLVASGSYDWTVRLWDVETGDCRQILIGHNDTIESFVFSPNGNQIASSGGNIVLLWDVETGDCRHILSGHDRRIYCVMYSPTGNQIASASADNTVRLWDAESGECSHILSGHSLPVERIAYSPAGDQIASSSGDMTVRLWDVETGECQNILVGHNKGATQLVYSPNGYQIASTSDDYTVHLWDVKTAECRHILTGHSEMVFALKYSPNGDMLASGSRDETVRLWDTTSGQCRLVIQNYNLGYSFAWKVGTDGNYLVAGCANGSLRLWKLIEDEDKYYARLHWRSPSEVLSVRETSLQGVHGLSRLNKRLLKQRGAVGEPRPPLSFREAGRKVASILSVGSKLKTPSNRRTSVLDTSLAVKSPLGQSGELLGITNVSRPA